MNISAQYANYIGQLRKRKLQKGVYTEMHHIVPRSWNGSDDYSNLVRVTVKEHVKCHKFLRDMATTVKRHNQMNLAIRSIACRLEGKDRENYLEKLYKPTGCSDVKHIPISPELATWQPFERDTRTYADPNWRSWR